MTISNLCSLIIFKVSSLSSLTGFKTIAFNFGIVLKEGNIDMRRLAFRVIVDFFGSLSFVDLL